MKFNTFSGSPGMTKKDFGLVSLSCIMIVMCGVSSEERSKNGWYTSICAFKIKFQTL